MPLWLLTLALAVSCPAALSELDRGLLKDALYQVAGDTVVLTSPPENRLLTPIEVSETLARLRGLERRAALARLERVQASFIAAGKLLPADRGAAQLTLARDWDLLPVEVRDRFNTLLDQNGAQPMPGPDLRWVEGVEAAWRKDPFGEQPVVTPFEGLQRAGKPQALAPTMSPPPPEEVQRRIVRVDSVGYVDQRVREYLREIMRYASDEDSAAVLRVLENRHPIIEISNAKTAPYSQATTSFAKNGGVALVEFKAYVGDIALPAVDCEEFKVLGLPALKLRAFDRSAKPKRVEKEDDGVREYFADGSSRWIPSENEQSATLLHELIHLDTHFEGGGAHTLTHELRSFMADERMQYNRDEAHGLTKAKNYGRDNDWLRRPLLYREQTRQTYMSEEISDIRPDELTVADQLKRNAQTLEATGAALDRMRVERIERNVSSERTVRLKMIEDIAAAGLINERTAAKARAHVEELAVESRKTDPWGPMHLLLEHQRLLSDQALTLKITGDDYAWHLSRGFGYGPVPKAPPAPRRGK